jgi:two-component system alkaline phosphatase synthesis response regulator PhoP
MAREKILVIEDDEDVLELVRYNLSREGYQVLSAETGETGLASASSEGPDLILLDLMLPEIDGFEVCRSLKRDRSTESIAIIMITARGEEPDIVTGLELGADDYITKPFSPRVLIARIRAVLRRRKAKITDDSGVISIHGLTVDPQKYEVQYEDRSLSLTSAEFRLLHFLARKPGRVFSRYQIVDGVKGADYPVTERSVDVQIVGLRKKLGKAGSLIETVRGVGYRLKDIYDE